MTLRLRSLIGSLTLAAGLAAAAPHTADAQFAALQVASNTAGNPLLRPIFLTSAPGDFRRAFIVEKQGRIRVLDMTLPAPTLQQDTTPFLDIRSLVVPLAAGNSGNQDERGLLGLAFHPQYQTNGKFYVCYCTPGVAGLPNSATFYCNVVEYQCRDAQGAPTPGANQADPSSARIIMQIPQPQSNHNGGWIGFGPDGYLYISVGDGGNANDVGAGHNATIGNGQDTGTPLGKVLRVDINVTGAPAQGPFVPGSTASYGIPADNPTITAPSGATGSRREIWAYGVRNPWRCSFDRLTGDFWMGEVGQGTWEEILFQPALTPQNLAQVAGRNYGWRCFEGTNSFNTNGGLCPAAFNSPGLTPPVGQYTHGQIPNPFPSRGFPGVFGCSISGGYVYRGCKIPALQGKYVFTDYCQGDLLATELNAGTGELNDPVNWSTVAEAGSAINTPAIPAQVLPINSLVAFGQDAYGELYLIDQPSARIFKLVPTGQGVITNGNCDYNFDGIKSVQDIFDFLGGYFGGADQANYNRDVALSVQDIFDFLACTFSTCQ